MEPRGGGGSIVLSVDNLPSHNHGVSCEGAGNHNHNRGNMEIYGSFELGDRRTHINAGGAFYRTDDAPNNTWADIGNGSIENKQRCNFSASRTWTGVTNTTGNHNHNISIGNTGNNSPVNIMNPYFSVNIWYRVE